MSENKKKEIKESQVTNKVVFTISVILLAFSVLYIVGRLMGGVYKEFVLAAAPWVFGGLGLIGILTVPSLNKTKKDDSQNSDK